MTWNAFHNRGEILREVVTVVDDRRDGLLPMHLTGVADVFRDELDLVAALSLKWHARLGVAIERELASEPMDLSVAVSRAWVRTATDLPGVRLVLDRCTEFPQGPDMAAALGRAERKECVRLAASAGLAHDESEAAAHAGRRLVEQARQELLLTADSFADRVTAEAVTPKLSEPSSLVDRIKAVIAA